MARYFYAWIPAVALAAVTLFIVPFLGLIAAVVFAAGAVAALGTFVGFLLTHRPHHIRRARAQVARPAARAQAVVAHRRPRHVGGARQRAAAVTAPPQTASALEYRRA